MADMKNLFKKVANSQATMGGTPIKDGKYLFEVQKLLVKPECYSGTMFIAELKVLEAEKVLDNVEPNKVGTVASFVCNLDKNVSAPGNMKALCLALLGESEAEANANPEKLTADMGALCGDFDPKVPSGLAIGMLLRDETFRKPIRSGKNAGEPFVAHRWQTVEQTDEEVEKRRAASIEAAKVKAA